MREETLLPSTLPKACLLVMILRLCASDVMAIELAGQLLTRDHPDEAQILATVSQPFNAEHHELIPLVEHMQRVMHQANGDGIAAIQVNSAVRVFLFRRYDKPPVEPIEVAINPEVLESSTQTHGSWDACLSVPTGVGRIQRHETIRVRYRNLAGEWINETLSGMTGDIFQHEMDHLNGLLFTHQIPDAQLLPLSAFFDLQDDIEIYCDQHQLGTQQCGEWADQQWFDYQRQSTPQALY